MSMIIEQTSCGRSLSRFAIVIALMEESNAIMFVCVCDADLARHNSTATYEYVRSRTYVPYEQVQGLKV